MRRLPNPWIAVPTLLAAAGGGVVGYFVTDASCAPDGCPFAAGIIGTITALMTAAGVGLVIVLMLKSLVEWREHADREVLTEDVDGEQGPPTC
jgi:hypothetical protein